MKVAIPDDWDGESWFCAQIQFPDSPQWLGLFYGMMAQFGRGRYWDEKTGNIRDVQEIAFEMYDRNVPIVSCDGEIIPPIDKEIIEKYVYLFSDENEGECTECEGNDMACCANPKAFGIGKDGKLYVRDCCNDWVMVQDIDVGVSDVPPVDTIPDPPPEGYTDSTACAKARKLAELTVHIVSVAFDTLDGFGILDVWDFWNDMQDAIPGVDLAMSEISNLWGYCTVLDLAGYAAEAQDSRVQQALQCAWAPLLTDDNAGITPDQYAEIILATDAALASIYPTNSLTGLGKSARFAHIAAIASIGKKDAEKVTFYVQPLETDNCDCPDDNPITAGSIWFNGTFSDGSGSGYAIEAKEVKDSGRRVLFQVAFSAGTNKNFIDLWAGLSGVNEGDFITVRMYPELGGSYPKVPANTYGLPNTSNVPTNLQMGLEFIGANSVDRIESTNYIEFSSSNEAEALLQRVQVLQGFNYPDPSASDVRMRFYWEIVAINGNSLGAIGP